jgi:hypothetical protein
MNVKTIGLPCTWWLQGALIAWQVWVSRFGHLNEGMKNEAGTETGCTSSIGRAMRQAFSVKLNQEAK